MMAREEIENQIEVLQGAVDKLIKLSYESDEMYNSYFGKMIDITAWDIQQNVATLRNNVEYLGGF